MEQLDEYCPSDMGSEFSPCFCPWLQDPGQPWWFSGPPWGWVVGFQARGFTDGFCRSACMCVFLARGPELFTKFFKVSGS